MKMLESCRNILVVILLMFLQIEELKVSCNRNRIGDSVSQLLRENMEIHNSELDTIYLYIIGACSGAVVLVITIIIIVCCCCKKEEQEAEAEAQVLNADVQANQVQAVQNAGSHIPNSNDMTFLEQNSQNGPKASNRSEMDETNLPMNNHVYAGVVDLEHRHAKNLEKEEIAQKNIKVILEKSNNNRGATAAKKSILDEIRENNMRNNNDSSTYSLTDPSFDNGKVKGTFYLGKDIMISDARSNPDPDENDYYSQMAGHNDEQLDEEPPMKKVDFVIDENDVLELKILENQNEGNRHNEFKKFNGSLSGSINVLGGTSEKQVNQIGANTTKQSNLDELRALTPSSKQPNLVTSSIQANTNHKNKINIKDQLRINMNKNPNYLLTVENAPGVKLGNGLHAISSVSPVDNSNSKLLIVNQNFNSNEREIPNNSFYNQSLRDESPIEADQRICTVELEEDEEEEEEEDEIYNRIN